MHRTRSCTAGELVGGTLTVQLVGWRRSISDWPALLALASTAQFCSWELVLRWWRRAPHAGPAPGPGLPPPLGVACTLPSPRAHCLTRRPEVEAAGKKALGMRYRLLPYLYSAFRAAHASGAPVMRPLWLNFPADPRTHRNDRSAGSGASHLPRLCCGQGLLPF